ncbi:hypothetical protein WISP_113946 [Willisornis vidua]|uniref:Uncharacterized protein n=1 Tax=Willisornis vidua TaxID=1566151 RepID=A0ABQ9CVK7_9PASS|nr:hypothetical protein WISP_113946 [Willisornis vidua]
MEVQSGAEIHLQPVEDRPILEQGFLVNFATLRCLATGHLRFSAMEKGVVVSLEPSIILYAIECLANIWDLEDKITFKAWQKNISQSKQKPGKKETKSTFSIVWLRLCDSVTSLTEENQLFQDTSNLFDSVKVFLPLQKCSFFALLS